MLYRCVFYFKNCNAGTVKKAFGSYYAFFMHRNNSSFLKNYVEMPSPCSNYSPPLVNRFSRNSTFQDVSMECNLSISFSGEIVPCMCAQLQVKARLTICINQRLLKSKPVTEEGKHMIL